MALAMLGSMQATWPEAQSTCSLSQAPIASASSSVRPRGMPEAFSKPWLCHASSSVSRTRRNTHKIRAKMLLPFNRSWAVPHGRNSQFLLS